MRITEVSYSIAVPARTRDVLLWVLTGGKYGKLFVRGVIRAINTTPNGIAERQR